MKHMKLLVRLSAFSTVGLLVLLAFVGLPVAATDCPEDYYAMHDLMAGQTIKVGYVLVTYDTANIYVRYHVDSSTGYYLTAVHFAIVAVDNCADCKDYFPHTGSGNPKIGQFPWSYSYDEEYDVTFTIAYNNANIKGDDNNGFEWGECLCFATHAVVEKDLGDGTTDSQTGWAGDHDFGGKSWAVYFCFKPIKKIPALPNGTIKYYLKNPGVVNTGATPPQYGCYWDTTVLEGGDGNVENNVRMDGWCIETTEYINNGDHYGVMSIYIGDGYHEINYIFNNIARADYTWEAFQLAVWYFALHIDPEDAEPVNGITVHQHDIDDAWDIIDIAEHYPNWFPTSSSQVLAVRITSTVAKQQDIIVLIDP